MKKIDELNELIKPVIDLIDKNKFKFDRLINEIEKDNKISDNDWDIINHISDSMLNLSTTGGDTSGHLFKKIIEKRETGD